MINPNLVCYSFIPLFISSVLFSPFIQTLQSPVSRPCHASTHSHVISLPLPPTSLSSSPPCILLLDGCCKPLSSEHFQLSHFFRVHGAGFSPLHQIFIEGETGEAGLPRAFLSSTHLTYIPLFKCPLNLPLSLSLSCFSFPAVFHSQV